MLIKKHKSKNQYFYCGDNLWVRDFTSKATPLDINSFVEKEDYTQFKNNEIELNRMNIPDVGSENVVHPNCLIVSDGYKFDEYKKYITELDDKICVIGVNRSLAKWTDDKGELLKRKMSYFIANNPYPTCMSLLPKHQYRPRCIIASKTYPSFAKKYNGTLYKYAPVYDGKYSGEESLYGSIDDYRNSICAAVGLSFKFKVRKLFLLCCDNVFDRERQFAEQIPNKMWIYPQHKVAHQLIDGNLYWLNKFDDYKIKTGYFSHGPEFKYAECVNISEVRSFFET